MCARGDLIADLFSPFVPSLSISEFAGSLSPHFEVCDSFRHSPFRSLRDLSLPISKFVIRSVTRLPTYVMLMSRPARRITGERSIKRLPDAPSTPTRRCEQELIAL